MSEHRPSAPSREQALDNFNRLDFVSRYVGNTVLIGIAPDGVTYQQVCIILGRTAGEHDRRFELSDWNQGQFIQTVPAPLSKHPFRPYPTMLSYDNQKAANHDLHVVTTGDRTRAILASMLPDPRNGRLHGQPFGTGEANYNPDPNDPAQVPRVSGLLNIGVGVKKVYGRKETHVNYNILTRAKYSEVSEYPLRTDAVPSTALAAHSYNPWSGTFDEPVPYEGFPYLLPLEATPEETCQLYWHKIPEEQRVAIAAVGIGPTERTYHFINAA